MLATLVAGCVEPTVATTSTTTRPPTTTSSTILATTTTAGPQLPGEAQRGIDWFVSILNGVALTARDYELRFDEGFRDRVDFEAMQAVLTDLRSAAPFRVVDREGDGRRGEAIIASESGERARVVAQFDARGRFTTLLVQPDETPTLEDPPGSVDEAFTRLDELGDLRALSAEIVDGSCLPVESVSAGEPAPLGSVFKLYVLAAVSEAVSAGEVDWEDTFTIEERLRSIPTGDLQNREPGSEITVGEAARLMISISDNTAADHLVDLLGREEVETVQGEYGNSAAGLNIPFLTTRELAALKVGPASGLRNPQWIEGDEIARRAILEQIGDITPDDLPLQEWTDPIDPDTVEWFASPEDLCSLAIRLLERSEAVPEVSAILEVNPGIPAATGTWDRIWFKGGSEPGLLAVWWVTESDGRVFVTSGSVVNPKETIDEQQAILLFAAARDLLAP